MRKQDTDLPQGCLGRLVRIAPWRVGRLLTLARLRGREVQPITAGGRAPAKRAVSDPNWASRTPVYLWWTCLFEQAGIVMVPAQRPPPKDAPLLGEGHAGVLAPLPFLGHWRAPAVWRPLSNDERHMRWRPCSLAPPLAQQLAQLLGGPTRDTASVLKTRGSRPAGVRAYGGCRGLATVPSRPGSPGPHRSERACHKRGRTGASLLAWAVCLWSRLLVCACVCRTPPLRPRLSVGLPGTCPGRRAAESPIGLGRVQCRLSSDGRLGWAAPAVGSLPGFFGGQPT
jgi:hypothetical protein